MVSVLERVDCIHFLSFLFENEVPKCSSVSSVAYSRQSEAKDSETAEIHAAGYTSFFPHTYARAGRYLIQSGETVPVLAKHSKSFRIFLSNQKLARALIDHEYFRWTIFQKMTCNLRMRHLRSSARSSLFVTLYAYLNAEPGMENTSFPPASCAPDPV